MAEPLGDRRELFDLPADVAYFNCASLAPLMRPVVAAGAAALERGARPWTVGKEDWFRPVERLRERFAGLIRAPADAVAMAPATSYGLAVAARNLHAEPGQRVLLLDGEYPSSHHTWKRFCARTGAELHTVRREPHRGWTDAVLAELDERTAVVCVPNVHWTNGALLRLAPIAERTRAVGAAFVVDASQSAGAMPLDVRELRPDFLVTVGYKWLLGPFAYGYLYADERHWSGEPLEENWISREGSEDFRHLLDYEERYRPGARRFDVGQRSSFQLVPMAQAALDQLAKWGVERVAATLARTTEAIARRAAALGLVTPPAEERGPHLVGLELPADAPEDLGARLARRGVYAGLRGPALRLSPHVYTTDDDVDRLFEALGSELSP